uniref:HS12B protein n=1 Tax=Pundamilia nyererei TaxID=303518 RepID=A0A3B4FEA2_9CICH
GRRAVGLAHRPDPVPPPEPPEWLLQSPRRWRPRHSEQFIIAIDFGTAYSGYAFSFAPKGAEVDPFLKTWGKELGLDTPKSPTCILFNEDEEFLGFGYEAKTVYIKMRSEETKKHYFFENFKMRLYDKVNMTIEAANGKTMKALKVFTEVLRYLKDNAQKTIARNTEGRKFIPSDFTWVLTVPAIWDPSAKQFMREAAAQAGIITEGTQHHLIIALEPEAASVWCKKLPADGFITKNHDGGSLSQGTQFMVVDCEVHFHHFLCVSSGTIDVTVHKVLDGGALNELHKASGNNLGGQTVDRKFKEFLREIFSHGVWDEYERNFPMKGFEFSRASITSALNPRSLLPFFFPERPLSVRPHF